MMSRQKKRDDFEEAARLAAPEGAWNRKAATVAKLVEMMS